MERLEHYLDRVCRGIRGPRSLRAHIRQELGEHLLDALAQHRAAGLSEEQALARALADFGAPEEVRSELEAQYGHRLLAVVIDKAMEWREVTMKAKWLWTTWAHLALALVIAVEVLFIVLAMLLIVPGYVNFRERGMLVAPEADLQTLLARCDSLLMNLVDASNHLVNYWYLWLLVLIVACALFEWRVHSENKSLMRLSALGMVALGAVLWGGLVASALVVSFTVALPRLHVRAPEPVVRRQAAAFDEALAALDKAMADKDWKASREHALAAFRAVDDLEEMGAAAPALVALAEQAKVDDARAKLSEAATLLHEAYNALLQEDPARASAALAKSREAYRQVPGVGK